LLAKNTRHRNNTRKRTRKVTTTITFRIDADTIDKLRAESTRHDVSLNTSVNKILKRYVQWDIFEPQAGTMPLAKPVVAELLANMSKEQITKFAKNIAKTAVQDILLVMKGKIDLDSFLSWFETLMNKAFIEINHTLENNDSMHRYTIKHNLGENWALLIQIIFNDVFGIRIDIINQSNTTLVFQFENNGDQGTPIIHSTSRI
jgi:hypothetical protein